MGSPSSLPPNYNDKSVRLYMQNMDKVTKKLNDEGLDAFRSYRKRITREGSNLLEGVSLHVSFDGLYVVVLDSSRFMNSIEERAVIKMVLSSKKLNSLHVCNSKTLGIGNKSFEIRRDHTEGPFIAIVLRDVLTLAESKQFLTVRKCHYNHSSWWSKGCEADPHPTSEQIVTQLSSPPRKMKSIGFASSNVKRILRVGPLRQDGLGRNIFRYESNKGQIVTRTLSTSLFRHKWERDGVNSLASVASRLDPSSKVNVIKKVANLYCVWTEKYLSSKGLTRDYVECIRSSMRESLMLSTLIIMDKNPIAVHRDRCIRSLNLRI
jgi:hypothetical protein